MHSFIKLCENIIEIILFHKLFMVFLTQKSRKRFPFYPDKKPPC